MANIDNNAPVALMQRNKEGAHVGKVIDADRAKRIAKEVVRTPAEQVLCDFICNIMDNLPAVETVPVVYCKYCKYHGTIPFSKVSYCSRPLGQAIWLGSIKETDFCSRGKPRDD